MKNEDEKAIDAADATFQVADKVTPMGVIYYCTVCEQVIPLDAISLTHYCPGAP